VANPADRSLFAQDRDTKSTTIPAAHHHHTAWAKT
jgi:hypothetical protein